MLIVALIALTSAILIWKYSDASLANENSFSSSSGVKQTGTISEASLVPVSSGVEKEKSVGAPLSNVNNTKSSPPFGERDAGSTSNSNLFGERLRKLLNSSLLTKTDYALLRINIPCGGSTAVASVREQQLTEAMTGEKKLSSNAANIAIGSATYQRRLASIDRFNELCKNILDGTVLSGEEYKTISASSDVVRWRAIAREASAEKLNLSNLQTKTALETVVTTPMYGALEGILYSKLDYSALINTFSEEQIAFLPNLIVPILLCRLGDDCGPDGFLTLQICRNNGICGNDVEGAIWEHLQSKQLNIESLRQFVDQRFRALSVLDFSILKSQK